MAIKRGSNWDLQRQAWADRRLSARDRLVLLCLVWHRNERTGRCDPGWDTVSAETGFSRSTVAEAVKRLESMGWIVGRREPGKTVGWLFNGSGPDAGPPPSRCRTGAPSVETGQSPPRERVPGYTDRQWEACRVMMRDVGLEQMRGQGGDT